MKLSNFCNYRHIVKRFRNDGPEKIILVKVKTYFTQFYFLGRRLPTPVRYCLILTFLEL